MTTENDLEVHGPYRIARTTWRSEDRLRVGFVYPDGSVGRANSDEPFDVDVGDIIEVSQHSLLPTTADAWPGEEAEVGVVRIVNDDRTVVSNSGRFVAIPTVNKSSYETGNTVLYGATAGVLSVLQAEPLSFLGDALAASSVAAFRHQPDPTLSFEHFGGLDSVKQRARELVELPLKHRDKMNRIGTRPIKGVLFTGGPGTGKTMLAKIIASQADAEFYKVSGPEIFSKYYGESEQLLRRIFEDAKAQERSVIFFDEIDSVAGRRSGDSHEASRRVVAQLLTLMDGFDRAENVVVIAATNRLEDIDPALLRPGRFDWKIEFPLPSSADRLAILHVSATGVQHSEDLPFTYIASATEGWSGAELAAIWPEATILAITQSRDQIWAEDFIGGFERVAAQRFATQPQLLEAT